MIRKTLYMFALSVMHIGILLICIGCSDDDDIAIQDVFCAQEAENVEDYEAVLNAKVPSNYVDAFRFELFTSSDMSEPIAYDIVSVDELPNSLEGITYIKMHIRGLESETKYYARPFVMDGENRKITGNVIEFTTTAPIQKNLTIGRARSPYTKKLLLGFSCNIQLTSGTISGQPERYDNLQVDFDRDNSERSNVYVYDWDKYARKSMIKVWNRGIEGMIYAYGGENAYTHEYAGGENHTSDNINVLCFNEIKTYYWGWGCGTSSSFDSEIQLKPTEAEIIVEIKNCTGVNTFLYLNNIGDADKVFAAGWLDLSTGIWKKDQEKNDKIMNEKKRLGVCVVEDGENTYSTRTFAFYHPPVEFGDNELQLRTYYRSTPLPAGKWEAGKSYKYTIYYR